MKKLSNAVTAITLLLFLTAAHAQTYPSRTITIVVGFAAGGGADLVARTLSDELTKLLGVQVIVDNRPGAGGTIGGEYVARANADGYTLLIGGLGPNATAHSLYPKIKYDTLRDFSHITLVTENSNALSLHASVPVKSISDLIALAKKNPGLLTYGSAGNGSAQHMAGELFKSMTKTNLLHIPYKGVAAGVNDLLAGRIDLMFPPTSNAALYVRSGRLKVLGVTTKTRSPALPEVPTIAEAGLPGYEQTVWNALLAPAGTPGEVVSLLHKLTTKALNSPTVKKRFESLGYVPRTTSPEQLTEYLKNEIARYAHLIKEAGIKLD
jgi:tripartite-type tricarboxylate transporter receptor subunit TctC